MAHSTFRSVSDAVKDVVKSLGKSHDSASDKAGKALEAVQKEAKIGPALHEQCLATLAKFKQKNPAIQEVLEKAYGYAILPSVGKANLVLGVAYGMGEVFEHGRVVGYAAIVQLTLGIQVGGETFDEIVVFKDAETFKRFKAGKFAFAANAAIAVVKAKAEASHGFGHGTVIYVLSDGGLQIVTSIGAQKFIFRPAALGRLRTADQHTSAADVPGADKAEKAEEAEEAEEAEKPKTHAHPKSKGNGKHRVHHAKPH